MSENQLSGSLLMRMRTSGSSVADGRTGGRHVHWVMENGLITVTYGGAAKRLQLPLQHNVIIMEEVEDGDGKAI